MMDIDLKAVAESCRREPGCTGQVNIGADYTPDELELLKAVDKYKRTHRRPFPTIREVLAIVRSLGYQKNPT